VTALAGRSSSVSHRDFQITLIRAVAACLFVRSSIYQIEARWHPPRPKIARSLGRVSAHQILYGIFQVELSCPKKFM
jgi:hypothetical protein